MSDGKTCPRCGLSAPLVCAVCTAKGHAAPLPVDGHQLIADKLDRVIELLTVVAKRFEPEVSKPIELCPSPNGVVPATHEFVCQGCGKHVQPDPHP